ncbi:MAG: hypothetical protein KC438_16080, partial [Thermomicrobiales bacterium]|nr:hypothetical protein [Thermomicrobiales bacterium]
MERIPLRGQVSIEGANAHPHAARRLRESFPAIEWIESTTLDRPAVSLAVDASLPEGAFAIDTTANGGIARVDVAGGPFSGVIYGVEEVIQRLARPLEEGFDLPAGRIEERPDLT